MHGDSGLFAVMKKPKLGTAQATALATGLREPRGIAVNDTHVFWTNADGTVMRAAK